MNRQGETSDYHRYEIDKDLRKAFERAIPGMIDTVASVVASKINGRILDENDELRRRLGIEPGHVVPRPDRLAEKPK